MDNNNNCIPPCQRGPAIYSGLFMQAAAYLVLSLFLLLTIVPPVLADNQEPIVVAYRLDSEPIQFQNKQGEADGILIDLWRLWSSKSGIPVRFVGAYSEVTQEMLRDGRADVIAGLFENEKRAAFMDFGKPVSSSHYYAYFNKALKTVKSRDDLNKARIGVTRGSYHEHWLRKHYPQAQLALYEGYQALFSAADRGDIEIFITQPRYLDRYVASHSAAQRYEHLQAPLYTRAYRAAVKKDNSSLLQTVNRNFARISIEERNQIEQRWSKGSIFSKRVLLTREELEWVKQNPVIRFTGDPNWLPFESFTEDGEYVGFVAEILSLISTRANLNIQRLPSKSWDDALRMTTAGEVDLISADLADETIGKVSHFTSPYVEYPLAIVMRNEQSNFIPDLMEIADRKIAIIRGYGYTWDVIKKYPDIPFIEVNNVQEGLSGLAIGKYDAFISTFALSSYHINQMGLQNLSIAGQIPITMKLGLAVRKDWPVLLGILNKTIATISPDEKHQIINKWMNEKYIERIDYSLIWKIMLVGGAIFLLVLIWGISIRQQKERLRKSEERFHLAMKAASEGIWDWKIPTDEVYYSPGYHTMLGFEVGELNPNHHAWEELLHPADKMAAIAWTQQAVDNNEKSYAHEFRLRSKSGDYRYVRSVGSIVEVSDDGKAVRAIGSQTDITEQKLAQEKLRASEAQFKTIVNAIPTAVFIMSQEGQVVMANPYALKEVGLDLASIRKRKMTDFCLADEGEKLLATLQESGGISRAPMSFNLDTGMVMDGLVSIISIVFDGKSAYLGLWVNLTERIQMERELEQAKESAEEANQFKSRFLANMSHEIRTPMNAIIGLCHLTLRTKLDNQQRDYLQKVQSASHTLLGIINDILDFSRIEAGRLYIEKVPFRVEEILASLSDLVTLRAEDKGLEILFDVAPDVPQGLIGDPTRITQVLINLTQNAIKFTEQGHVVVHISVDKNNNDRYLFEVRDTGIGIDAEILPELFESFSQADTSTTRQYGGSGLGLAICKQLIELMGGEVDVKSRPGSGSRFYFTLPLERQEEKILPGMGRLAGKVNAIVVDDNPVACDILAEMLSSFRFNVKTFNNAFAALEELTRVNTIDDEPHYNLILLDWKMPGLNGLEAAEKIRMMSNLKEIPALILVTAHNHADILQQAESAELDGLLLKPVSPSILFDAVAQALLNDKPAGDSVKRKDPRDMRLQGNVLLVEDNSINRLVAREILESLGLAVTDAVSGEAALDILKKRPFDLVLMDIQMPGMDGYETTGCIRKNKEWAKLPVVAMTAHAMAGDRQRCLDAGMNEHIPKPIDPFQVYQLLSKWLSVEGQVEASMNTDEASLLSANLPGIDVVWGLNRVGGKRSLYSRLLCNFLNDHNGNLDELKAMLQDREISKARRIIHTLHGVSANLGAKQLERLSSQLEKEIHAGSFDFESLTFSQLESEFVKVMAGLRTWFKSLSEEKCEGVTLSLDRDNVTLLKQFEEFLSEGNPQVQVLFDQVSHELVARLGEHRVDEMRRLADDYEFNLAYELYKQP